ncbi:MAG: RNA-guided pseudouridylation complex pseudouridine synthase subunit Cbf5 [Candidatus Thermoplasmatota archaeon]|nr:RNA-guided pseudouridylation complex pseudouridine synthase subunit Cbf5 [Candidatus Thermoplasmatota archaeon]
MNFGFVVIDKPRGPTSHQVSAWVKEILGISKAGHVGTLDPNVTGVLPVGLEKATRLADFLHEQGKEYVSLMLLHKQVDRTKIEDVLKEFTGEIFQFPPLRSAVARNLRKRSIYSLKLMEVKDRHVLFKADVESGVYIRTLCRDMGDALLVGANMVELRRTRSGPLNESYLSTLQKLKDAFTLYREGDEKLLSSMIIDPEQVTKDYSRVVVKESAIDAMAHGATIFRKGILEDMGEGKTVRIMSPKGELLGMGTREAENIKPEVVLVDRDVYPKGWKSSS